MQDDVDCEWVSKWCRTSVNERWRMTDEETETCRQGVQSTKHRQTTTCSSLIHHLWSNIVHVNDWGYWGSEGREILFFFSLLVTLLGCLYVTDWMLFTYGGALQIDEDHHWVQTGTGLWIPTVCEINIQNINDSTDTHTQTTNTYKQLDKKRKYFYPQSLSTLSIDVHQWSLLLSVTYLSLRNHHVLDSTVIDQLHHYTSLTEKFLLLCLLLNFVKSQHNHSFSLPFTIVYDDECIE